jgi:hypothetical protein
VDGYRLSFLMATGLAVLAVVIVALQFRTRSHRAEPVPAGADRGAGRDPITREGLPGLDPLAAPTE